MKAALCTLSATLFLTGCLATNQAKNDSVPAEPVAAQKPAEAAPAPAQAAAPETPCVAEPAPAKAAKGKSTAKQNGKTAKKKETAAPAAAAPCKPAAGGSVAAAPAKPAAAAVTPATPAVAAVAASSSGERREVKGINDWTGYIEGVPPSGSKFHKLKIGMGTREVMDLVGAPTDQQMRITGKAFIPFYHGSGKHETYYYYKGVGRLLFAGNAGYDTGMGLIGIEHDAKENGYSR